MVGLAATEDELANTTLSNADCVDRNFVAIVLIVKRMFAASI